MTLYYIKQDDTISGCGDPECCGEYYESVEESFLKCEHENVSAEHLHSCNGGGPVLEWREATPLEVLAYKSGGIDSHVEGWELGIEQEQNRILELLDSNKLTTASEIVRKSVGIEIAKNTTETFLDIGEL